MRTQLDRTQDHLRAGVSPSGTGSLVVELGRVVGHEVAAGPVALEDRGELGDHVGVAGRRHPDVPLQAGDLGRMGEVRRADVGGREAGLTVEHPGFGMEACRARVVGDANVGAEVDELIDCRALGRVVYVVVSTRSRRPASQCRRRLSSRGLIPLRRMKATTTSIASADSISDCSWLHNVGSPLAWVSRVVSSNGISGTAIGSRRPVRVATPHRPQDRSRLDRARCGVRRGEFPKPIE